MIINLRNGKSEKSSLMENQDISRYHRKVLQCMAVVLIPCLLGVYGMILNSRPSL